MKINFDNFRSTTESRPSASTQSPIKISIESPVYNSVVRQVSPNNYQSELNSINGLINLPVQVSRFLQKQIEKQMIVVQRQQKGKKYAEVPQGMGINFLQRTSSQIIQKQKLKSTTQKIPQKTPQNNKKPQNPQINSIMRSTKNKPHKKQSPQIIPTQARHTLTQISQLTCQPFLYPSKITNKIEEQRKQINYGYKKYSVYDNLYNEASDRKLKSCLLNQVIQRQSNNNRKPKINSNYFRKSKLSYTSIYCRLDGILEDREVRRQGKLGIDQTTGRELFKPDTSFSKDSYRIFFNSLSKQKLTTKRNQPQQLTHPLPLKPSPTNPTTNTIDTKTIQHFTNILYPDQQIPHIAQQNPLRKQQFMILHPFLHEIEQLQSRKYEMETTTSSVKTSTVGERDKNKIKNKIRNILSREEFQTRLRKFYKGLSLHDRQVLRKETVYRRRNHMESHVIKQDEKVFKPVINVRSASLDNLAKGHAKNIYYI